jgi:energy-coupling factor transporter ATP-binding protein EcfA2
VTSRRVNIRASKGDSSYYDSLDLYTARARSTFAGALQRTWGAEPSRVEKDLILILEYLETERDRTLSAGPGTVKIIMSESEKQAGLDLLRDPALFTRIDSDLSELGYVGEELNKQLLYLCASSRKLDDPLSVLIVSQSASGKSFLVDCVKKLMPPEEVVCVTSLSDQALNYIDDLTHKFLILGEAVHGEVVEHQIREMLSGKELSRLVTVKDAETGKMQSKVIRTPVIVSSVMSTTNNHINPENASRCFVVNTDESKSQTARIHEHQRQKYSLERLKTGPASVAQIIRTHQAAQRLLESVAVVNDFAPLLDFPVHLMRLRRDHDRFLDLIACVCFLRQFQKQREISGGLSFIRCDLEDYEVAWKIMTAGIMQATVQELPEAALRLYEELRSWVKDQAKAQNLKSEELSFTQRQVREFTGLGHTWIKYTLRVLTDYEYLVVVKGSGERSKAFYKLRDDREIALADVSRIPSPQAMAEKLRNFS